MAHARWVITLESLLNSNSIDKGKEIFFSSSTNNNSVDASILLYLLLEGQLLLWGLLQVDIDAGLSDVRLNEQDGQGQEDQMETSEAVLESHEGEVSLVLGQVHLRHVHVRRVGDQEDEAHDDDKSDVQETGALGRGVLGDDALDVLGDAGVAAEVADGEDHVDDGTEDGAGHEGDRDGHHDGDDVHAVGELLSDGAGHETILGEDLLGHHGVKGRDDPDEAQGCLVAGQGAIVLGGVVVVVFFFLFRVLKFDTF